MQHPTYAAGGYLMNPLSLLKGSRFQINKQLPKTQPHFIVENLFKYPALAAASPEFDDSSPACIM